MKYFIIAIYLIFFGLIYGALVHISQKPGIVFLAVFTGVMQVWVQFMLTDYFNN